LDEFYSLDRIEFNAAITAKIDEENKKFIFENDLRRLQTFYLLNVQLDEEHRLDKPEDLIRFNWDKVEKKVDMGAPDFEELTKRYNLKG
jgi:hypothetical protein